MSIHWDHAGSWPPSCWPHLLWSSLLWAWTACCVTTVLCSTKASPAPTSQASVCPISAVQAPEATTAPSASCLLRAAWTLISVAPMKSSHIGESSTTSATPAAAKTNVTCHQSLASTWRRYWGWITLTTVMFSKRRLGIHVQITHHQGAPNELPLHHRCACRRLGRGLLAIGA